MAWFRFFLGTPRRFLTTAGGAAIIFGFFRPDLVAGAVSGLLTALMGAIAPLIQPIMTLMIVFIGLGVILRSVWPRKKGGKK